MFLPIRCEYDLSSYILMQLLHTSLFFIMTDAIWEHSFVRKCVWNILYLLTYLFTPFIFDAHTCCIWTLHHHRFSAIWNGGICRGMVYGQEEY